MILFNGFPFLDNKEETSFGVPVSQVMIEDLTVLPQTGMKLSELEEILNSTSYQGFPIVPDRNSRLLMGYINRSEIRYGIDRARRERSIPPEANCFFSPPGSNTMGPLSAGIHITSFSDAIPSLDFIRFIDPTPLTVHPRLPLDTVMEIFKKVGPRVVLVEHHGKLCGIVTRKDVLRFQFELENRENPRSEEEIQNRRRGEDKLWQLIVRAGSLVKEMVIRRPPRLTSRRPSYDDRRGTGISDGVYMSDNEVEMNDRYR